MYIYTFKFETQLSNVFEIEPSYIIELSDQKINQSQKECKEKSTSIESLGNKAWRGQKHTEEAKNKISNAHKGRDAYWIKGKKNPKHSIYMTKRNLECNHMKGIDPKKHPMFGRKREDTSEWIRSQNAIQGICTHCGKIGQLNALKRWHFDNCQFKT